MTIVDEFTRGELAEMFQYLDQLRTSGVTNMFAAAPYLEGHFDLDEEIARAVLASWMQSFDANVPAADRVGQLGGSDG